jgi:hypothetical protein
MGGKNDPGGAHGSANCQREERGSVIFTECGIRTFPRHEVSAAMKDFYRCLLGSILRASLKMETVRSSETLVTPDMMVDGYQLCEGIYCLHLQRRSKIVLREYIARQYFT